MQGPLISAFEPLDYKTSAKEKRTPLGQGHDFWKCEASPESQFTININLPADLHAKQDMSGGCATPVHSQLVTLTLPVLMDQRTA